MNRKEIFISLVIVLVFIAGIYAGVQMQSKTMKQFKFDLGPGQRIIIVSAGAETYFRIKPAEAKVFDYRVSEGKSMKGILVEE